MIRVGIPFFIPWRGQIDRNTFDTQYTAESDGVLIVLGCVSPKKVNQVSSSCHVFDVCGSFIEEHTPGKEHILARQPVYSPKLSNAAAKSPLQGNSQYSIHDDYLDNRVIAELRLLFGTHYEYRGNSTAFEWEVSNGIQGVF